MNHNTEHKQIDKYTIQIHTSCFQLQSVEGLLAHCSILCKVNAYPCILQSFSEWSPIHKKHTTFQQIRCKN